MSMFMPNNFEKYHTCNTLLYFLVCVHVCVI